MSIDPSQLPACAANLTVGEIDQCLSDRKALYLQIADTVTCATPSSAFKPASCAHVDAICPGLIEPK
jgi:hypothetical protein